MRILHTSDWHLGKRLYKLDRTPEHEAFLKWLLNTLIEEKIDVLLIAGDIFDTPTPPHQSLEIFYNFLHQVSTETETDTYIIAGNHDSGLLLEAPGKILASHRVKVWGKLSEDPARHWMNITKNRISLNLCALPFFRSYELLPQGEGDALEALKKYLGHEAEGPKLLMLHHLAGMYEAAGSEQVINLSGVDSIPTDLLKTFQYVALGHIHKPQKIGENIFYSGSPIPLRFSETIKKSVRLLEVKENEIINRDVFIPVFRNLFQVRTTEEKYKKDLEDLKSENDLTAMVEIQINLTAPKMGLLDEIKCILAQKNMELLSYLPLYEVARQEERKADKIFELSPLELFEEFYAAKFPESKEIPEDLKSDFKALIDKVSNAAHPS